MRAQIHSAHVRTLDRSIRPHVRRSSAGTWQDSNNDPHWHRSTSRQLDSEEPSDRDSSTAPPIDCLVSISTEQAEQAGRKQPSKIPTTTIEAQQQAQHSNNKEQSTAFPHHHSDGQRGGDGEYTHNNSRNTFRISLLRDPSTPVDDASY